MPRSSKFSSIHVYQPNFVFPISPIFVTCLTSLILLDLVTEVFSFNMKNGNFYILLWHDTCIVMNHVLL
jgi:hypothetical protein